MEPFGIFLDVRFDGKEVQVDELGGLGILVTLGIQPSTCASSGRGAEVEQDGLALGLSVRQGLIYVFAPFHGHIDLPLR